MNKLHSLLIFIALWILNSFCYSQGLAFKGNNYIINERTSFNVFNNEKYQLNDSLVVAFDFSTTDTSQTGYIFRLKQTGTETTYNLNYDSNQNTKSFKLNREGKSTLIALNFNSTEFNEFDWIPIEVTFNFIKGIVSFSINNKNKKCPLDIETNNFTPTLYFGKSEYFIDVPTFSIKNLTIKSSNKNFYYPLNEHKGTMVHESKNQSFGLVNNPIWLINDSYHWKKLANYKSEQVAGYNFDDTQHSIYFITS